jgi:hypothetical protein
MGYRWMLDDWMFSALLFGDGGRMMTPDESRVQKNRPIRPAWKVCTIASPVSAGIRPSFTIRSSSGMGYRWMLDDWMFSALLFGDGGRMMTPDESRVASPSAWIFAASAMIPSQSVGMASGSPPAFRTRSAL